MTEKPIDPDGERFVPPVTDDSLDDTDLPPAAELPTEDVPAGLEEDPEGQRNLTDPDPDRLAGDPEDSRPDPGEDT
ncbi:hypothetical protein [Nocardioides solisilvae]|uniref:hypothetical protein n=1 Tax=Nocardioides solisilvae TaxID=1542435 RepID=UPI000D74520D|nr:hypothetical protein [Nocardioides solisilvae]